ncbi:hypothetical protein RND71_002939 [Anisodus tanguticus]|uniref:Uncharacterized protein n=1 Tax=Anisodus tanguticus TaxID=243964 RepID=A0AAE1VN71_9SOLA|nr:hypothetical protein RND71_002939 [Anisodus tanguticus]
MSCIIFRMLEEGKNIVEVVERTFAQFNLPQEHHCKFNSSFMQEDNDVLIAEYAPIPYQDALQSKIYSNSDPYHSSSSMMVMQTMTINTFTIEEQLASLTKAIVSLTKHVQEQDVKLFKLTNKMENIAERESIQAHVKLPDIQEK